MGGYLCNEWPLLGLLLFFSICAVGYYAAEHAELSGLGIWIVKSIATYKIGRICDLHVPQSPPSLSRLDLGHLECGLESKVHKRSAQADIPDSIAR